MNKDIKIGYIYRLADNSIVRIIESNDDVFKGEFLYIESIWKGRYLYSRFTDIVECLGCGMDNIVELLYG